MEWPFHRTQANRRDSQFATPPARRLRTSPASPRRTYLYPPPERRVDPWQAPNEVHPPSLAQGSELDPVSSLVFEVPEGPAVGSSLSGRLARRARRCVDLSPIGDRTVQLQGGLVNAALIVSPKRESSAKNLRERPDPSSPAAPGPNATVYLPAAQQLRPAKPVAKQVPAWGIWRWANYPIPKWQTIRATKDGKSRSSPGC